MKASILFFLACLAISSDHYVQGSSDRVVGGVEAGLHEFPSILSMGKSGCQATLIHPKWALTAISCSIRYTHVVGGDHLIKIDEGTEQTRRIIRRVQHMSNGNPNRYSYNILLLELEEPFELNEYVQVMKLPPRDFSPTGEATVAGWGYTEIFRPSDKLRKATVPIVQEGECREGMPGSTDESVLCAGTIGIGRCHGDDGAPLYCDTKNGTVLCAVASWLYGCGLENNPAVYCRTSHVLDFIESTIGEKLV